MVQSVERLALSFDRQCGVVLGQLAVTHRGDAGEFSLCDVRKAGGDRWGGVLVADLCVQLEGQINGALR